jgi:Tfp pilus assembly protein PilF
MTADAIEEAFERARRLESLGRIEAARDAYLGVIALEPAHLGALNNLGNLLDRSGFRRAARLTFAEALKRHPEDAGLRVNFGNSFLEGGEFESAREHYEAALGLDPDLPEAHQGLCYVLDRLGDDAGVARHLERGFRARALTPIPFRGEGTPIAALLLVSARGGNVSTREYLSEKIFAAHRVFAEFFPADAPLPPHAIVFNAIGDADRCRPALENAARLIKRTDAPVINAPERVLETSRAAAARFRGIPGVVVPRISLLARGDLIQDGPGALAERGFSFPLLLRTPGHHTGRYFELVPTPRDVEATVEKLPGDRLMAIEYLDARHADGKTRKYRVLFVDGRIYPVHLAISRDWKVHYFSAEMNDAPEHRAEEERFLEDMPGVLGSAAMAALERIARVLGLDYAGIDFGVNRRGRLLFFEANAAMIAPPPPDGERWRYRLPHVQRIYEAVRAMLFSRVERAPTR